MKDNMPESPISVHIKGNTRDAVRSTSRLAEEEVATLLSDESTGEWRGAVAPSIEFDWTCLRTVKIMSMTCNTILNLFSFYLIFIENCSYLQG
jgi:hypothetical protein